MINIQTWLIEHSNQLNQFNKPIDIGELRQLIGLLLQKNNTWLFSHPEYKLNPKQLSQLEHWNQLLLNGYPLAYITGKQNFWDMELSVNEDTLIPRPDTETLLEVCIALFENPPQDVLDLGTGSGAIAIALARIFDHANVLGVDLSKPAVETAIKNAKYNQTNNVKFLVSDWFSAVVDKKFDLIVSNPPYIAEDDEHLVALKYEPASALIAANDGLANFKAITSQAFIQLNHTGILVFEHGWQQKVAVQNVLKEAGFKDITTVRDLAGQDRVTFGKKHEILGN